MNEISQIVKKNTEQDNSQHKRRALVNYLPLISDHTLLPNKEQKIILIYRKWEHQMIHNIVIPSEYDLIFITSFSSMQPNSVWGRYFI